jgi:hypothetical protein
MFWHRPETNSGGSTTGRRSGGSAVLRRQTGNGRLAPAGSSRAERLDPFALPLRFTVDDRTADERVRSVELTGERVVLRRSVRGMRIAVNLPVKSYLGVALRIEPRDAKAASTVAVTLEHRDGALSLPLYSAPTAAMSLLNGSRGRGCSSFRSWSRSRTAACASRSRESARFGWLHRLRDAASAPRSGRGGLRSSCGAGAAARLRARQCIAANARSSRDIRAMRQQVR